MGEKISHKIGIQWIGHNVETLYIARLIRDKNIKSHQINTSLVVFFMGLGIIFLSKCLNEEDGWLSL